MAVVFKPSQVIGRGDLDIFLTDISGVPKNAAEISYAVYWVDPGPPEVEVLIGDPVRVPVNPSVGEYYASLMVPSSAVPGDYRIRWTFRELTTSQQQQVVQEFGVVSEGCCVDASNAFHPETQKMINTLRVLLRDQNPDKFYHFRPPEHEGKIGTYNRVFGQIWEDAELAVYLERALDWWDMFPPMTNTGGLLGLATRFPQWGTAIYWGAITHALFALSLNWVADEFSYSIGGISLDLEKSSKYESLKGNAEGQFDKATEAKARTVKFIKGLSQPKYGMGIRSAFGPNLARGTLSPRSFLVLAGLLPGVTLLLEVLEHVSHMPLLWS